MDNNAQMERLTTFLEEEYPNWHDVEEPAVDRAARIMREQKRMLDAVSQLAEHFNNKGYYLPGDPKKLHVMPVKDVLEIVDRSYYTK